MQRLVSLQDAKQDFVHYIHDVEQGMEIILTRKGKPIAKMVPLGKDSMHQQKAHARLLLLMKKGLTLKEATSFTRDELHER